MDQSLQSADYVIIGAGSAGCALAARLSEDPSVKVILVEAGGADSSPIIHLPVGYARTMGDPRYDWCYQAGPEPGLNGRMLSYARGKVIGGSSSINGLAWVRGGRADYDAWRDGGCAGWGWDDVLPYFMRAESFAPGGPGRGQDGPVPVEFNPGWHGPSAKLLEAGLQAGLPMAPDHNSEAPLGLSRAQLNWRGGRRMSAAASYLKPARKRPNLRVVTGATVERLAIENGAATGAHVRTAAGPQLLRADREVILSAGAFGTPLILQQSGVGDGGRLPKLGIEVKADAPEVGENLQDHLLVMMSYRIAGLRTINDESRGVHAPLNLLRYLLFRRGLLSGTPTEVIGYGRTSNDGGPADVQFFAAPVSFSMQQKNGKAVVALDKTAGLSFGMYGCRPRSRGHVRLTSPAGGASIVSNYLADAEDRKVVIAGLRLCREITSRPAIAPYITAESAPGAGAKTDEDLLGFARAAGGSAYHAVGSCRMGGDDRSVVDLQLRMRAVRRLRIVDASVMPAIIGANTHAPVVMIAERAADFIRRS